MDSSAYAADAERMKSLASAQSGFISYKSFLADDGETVSISEWRSAEDARAWAHHPDHVDVQSRGRAEYYDSYVVYSCADPDVRHFQRNS